MKAVRALAAIDPEWTSAVATIFLGIATVGLGFVAVYQDRLHRWLRRPRLRLLLHLGPPDCHKTTVTLHQANGIVREAGCYYFCLRVENEGRGKAENVEVVAESLEKKLADGSFQICSDFLPMNLTWSHTGGVFREAISPGMGNSCDLLHIIEPSKRSQIPGEDKPGVSAGETLLSFDTEVKTNTLSHLRSRGTYRLSVTLAAANAKPVRRRIDIVLTGTWHGGEKEMFTEGVRIGLVDS